MNRLAAALRCWFWVKVESLAARRYLHAKLAADNAAKDNRKAGGRL